MFPFFYKEENLIIYLSNLAFVDLFPQSKISWTVPNPTFAKLWTFIVKSQGSWAYVLYYLHDSISPSDLHILIVLCGLVHLVVLGKRTVCVQETVIRGNQDLDASKFIGDDPNQIFQLFHRGITGGKDRALHMSGFVNGVVIDIDHVHMELTGNRLSLLLRTAVIPLDFL